MVRSPPNCISRTNTSYEPCMHIPSAAATCSGVLPSWLHWPRSIPDNKYLKKWKKISKIFFLRHSECPGLWPVAEISMTTLLDQQLQKLLHALTIPLLQNLCLIVVCLLNASDGPKVTASFWTAGPSFYYDRHIRYVPYSISIFRKWKNGGSNMAGQLDVFW